MKQHKTIFKVRYLSSIVFLYFSFFSLPLHAELKPHHELFSRGTDYCKQASDARGAVQKFKTINIKDFGAYGDGKSHKIRSIRALHGSLPSSLQRSLSLVLSHMSGKSLEAARKSLDMEADWVALQAALLSNRKTRQGTRVVIPDSGADFLIDRSISVGSNTVLEWLGKRSFLRITEPSERGVGAVISNLFPYDSDRFYNYDDQACFIRIINPRIDAGGLEVFGQNGIAFANGVRDVVIVGGLIKNSRFGTPTDVDRFTKKTGIVCDHQFPIFSQRCPDLQGGRGIQLESGVQDIEVRQTQVIDSTMAFSAAAGLGVLKPGGGVDTDRALWRPINGVANLSWNIRLKDVVAKSVELPLLVSNFLVVSDHPDLRDKLATKVVVDGLRAINSGGLTQPLGLSPDQSDPKLFLKSAIIGSFGADQLTIDDVEVINSQLIGSFFRGFGRNISVKKVNLVGDFQNLLLLDGRVMNVGYNIPDYGGPLFFYEMAHRGTIEYGVNGQLNGFLYFETELDEVAQKVIHPGLLPFVFSDRGSAAQLKGDLTEKPVAIALDKP